MEAVLLHGSVDQSISPYKSHVRKPKKTQHYPFIYRPSDNFLLASHFRTAGLLQAPPPPFLSHSHPPYSQPPLLPLPTANPRGGATISGLPCPPSYRKTNNGGRNRDSSLIPKKSKSPHRSPKKKEKNPPKKSPENVTTVLSSTAPLGPDPKEMPKNVAKVLPLVSSGNLCTDASNCINTNSLSFSSKAAEDQVDQFSGSVVCTISPPPSSLPLPTFSLRPKLGCNAEAAGIDIGATDNLRRLLRLR